MNVIAIIPARMGASRFPGKPMEKICCIPMIGHVYFRTKLADTFSETYVATCDEAIFNYIESIGGKAIMTLDEHERATDRTAEALSIIESKGTQVDVVIMVQGDEPLLMPEMLDTLIPPFVDDKKLQVTNLMGALNSDIEFKDPNEVKVVCDLNNHALYFSREAIPSTKKWDGAVPMKKQLGIIAFRSDYLKKFSQLEQTPLEKIESVDMMRVLEHGEHIKMIMTDYETIGVDTPEELNRVSIIMKNDNLLKLYKNLAT